jgi:cob(I)alamin adenosyltransferase
MTTDATPTTPVPLPTHDRPRPQRRRVDSIVLVNTGDGKGKSTAAFGTLMRAVARGWSVGVVQFMKSGKYRVGEEKIARDLGVEWWTIGDGFTWESDDLNRSAAIAARAWAHASELLESGRHDLLVLDEITYPVNYGWLDGGSVWPAIRERAPRTNVFCTGRNAPPELVDLADTVTEMRKVKHAYDAGIGARRGIDL